jgi:hypothetical protein
MWTPNPEHRPATHDIMVSLPSQAMFCGRNQVRRNDSLLSTTYLVVQSFPYGGRALPSIVYFGNADTRSNPYILQVWCCFTSHRQELRLGGRAHHPKPASSPPLWKAEDRHLKVRTRFRTDDSSPPSNIQSSGNSYPPGIEHDTTRVSSLDLHRGPHVTRRPGLRRAKPLTQLLPRARRSHLPGAAGLHSATTMLNR